MTIYRFQLCHLTPQYQKKSRFYLRRIKFNSQWAQGVPFGHCQLGRWWGRESSNLGNGYGESDLNVGGYIKNYQKSIFYRVLRATNFNLLHFHLECTFPFWMKVGSTKTMTQIFDNFYHFHFSIFFLFFSLKCVCALVCTWVCSCICACTCVYVCVVGEFKKS